ncbi:hypothetical protein A2Z10_02945 [Candidatus Azambacteria bacterium RBG_16_47_10]|uniref:tRNA-binding domain-containing protein n=1 Tax=Candidatus Azambacteria bacterium RBG_16_47_10 TaxID=1797292 RepID=A0A1F5B0U3_9BACT|nr:MAG: hypothetical protein A2Z10_02945 [Candidatus Azambacteria bacterium RBG_16_47_10]
MITFDEFKKTELRVATITAAERVEGSEKLIKLQLDLGVSASVAEEKAPVEGEEQISVSEPVRETRQIVAGIGKRYAPEELIGKQIIIVANLAPRALMGIESHGMLLAASSEEGPILLMPEKAAPSGAQVG